MLAHPGASSQAAESGLQTQPADGAPVDDSAASDAGACASGAPLSAYPPAVLGIDADPAAPRSEDQLRSLLGLEPVEGAPLPRQVRVNGWIATVVAGVVAAFTRLVGLGHPHQLMFDEIYYVKDGYALWHNGYESTWSDDANELFARGDFSALTTEPSYVVHPQLGKWLIGLGMQIFGADSPFGWRFMPALAGILTVIILARLTLRLTRSPLLAGLAGLLLAIDGVGITESRIGLLDIFIGLFATAALYCLVRDREWSRARLAADLAGTLPDFRAPRAHLRPWLLATGLMLGLTCSIKWSGAYLLAAVGVLVVAWDTQALRRVQARAWFLEGLVARGVGDFIRLVPVAFVVYLVAGWGSWFLHDGAYRDWAQVQRAEQGSVARGWLPDALNSLLEYHLSMYNFHVQLDSEHPYMSKPIGWLLQLRPTSFYWLSEQEMSGADCGSDRCIQAITSIGNIPIWWGAVLALPFAVVVLGARNRDWRIWVPLIGYVGLYLPWFIYSKRTIFTFYTVAFVPCVVLILVLSVGSVAGLLRPVPGSVLARREAQLLAEGRVGPGRPWPRGPVASFFGFGLRPGRIHLPSTWTGVPTWRVRSEGVALIGSLLVTAATFALLWSPIWTGKTVPYTFWLWHMWLESWV
ncbi:MULTISPECIES: phospholipid carrier-dependent glycosyltransferase [unclassified Actinomyces]|uniref:dolichyl-phosphate-mannose--protein mannosyltransferase n=1 Tax=unclassified Actinomyces TaxID=2609248 RepID=UPI0013A6DC79|nr:MULTISPECIES: phospholipid carrier-dependent glycosyltransferase [unclassified Actinomyces]MBW3069412.1 phospholipid carrier-dependent glycosyltransferase [Actinomyces sp. 594]NDR53717.1 phospholipid carrier-dependent glycosyltransferase [Actinomyces sp. 565]